MSEKAANVERNPLKDPQKAWRTIAQKDWVDQDFYTLMCTPYISTYTRFYANDSIKTINE